MAYLEQLSLRLLAGMSRLPEELLAPHRRYVQAQQRPDGGFAGRQGNSDAYYTGFGLRAAAMLGVLDEATAGRAAQFLSTLVAAPRSTIDFLSLVFSAALLEAVGAADPFAQAGRDRRETVAAYLAPLQRADGGYAPVATGQASTYHTFLALGACEMLNLERGPMESTAALVRRRRRADGGFVEFDPLPNSGTNPTAAAVGALRILGGIDDDLRQGAAAFLLRLQSAQGGWCANTRLPLADLLSTFTALVALADLDALDRVDRAAVSAFVGGLQDHTGGFRGGAWDDAVDVEYTFYGLGSLALLAPEEDA